MPIAVRSFGALADAASALSTERGARFLAGGTLVMRAINEGDVSFATIIRRPIPLSARSVRPASASRSVPA